jgi:hypothetical protein
MICSQELLTVMFVYFGQLPCPCCLDMTVGVLRSGLPVITFTLLVGSNELLWYNYGYLFKIIDSNNYDFSIMVDQFIKNN